MASEYTPNVIKTLKQKVYTSARDGMAISIFAMLWNVEREIVREVLEHHTEEDGQTTTPLIIAARNGEEKVVGVLLSNFSVDIEQTGTVKFDGFVIEGATSLWCASGAGNFGVVKLLIEHGANVNHPTLSSSTPLRAACFDGRLDIVKYLIEHEADLTISNKYSNTCLMISCYKGHRDVVRYLLEKRADPDCTAHCGATALHFSAECGHIEIVQELVKYGASSLKNDHNMTPLIVAAECGKSEVVEYLISLPTCTKQEKIDALELLGASFANDKEKYNISKAFMYLREGMQVRFSDPACVISKPPPQPVEAYDNRKECETVAELDSIRRDFGSLHMESLAIRERILGQDNPEVPHPVIFRGAVFADSARFDRCICLWLHAMRLRQRNKRTISKDLLRFAQVFSQMVHIGVKLAFTDIECVFSHAVIELQNDMERISKGEDDKDSLNEIYQSNIHTCLYLLVIALKVPKSESNENVLHKLVYQFLKLKPVLKNQYSPLHMAVDNATLVDDFHVNDVVTFPNSELIKLLIKCGADTNAFDNHRNTPLHVIVKYANAFSDIEKLHTNMMALIKNGAHLDICNADRKTPIDCSVRGIAELILRTNHNISLKCIAAKVIQKQKIQYKGLIPSILEEFIQLH